MKQPTKNEISTEKTYGIAKALLIAMGVLTAVGMLLPNKAAASLHVSTYPTAQHQQFNASMNQLELHTCDQYLIAESKRMHKPYIDYLKDRSGMRNSPKYFQDIAHVVCMKHENSDLTMQQLVALMR